ncbi:Putative ribonuclease H protein At1g65750 [Linum perenne]
MWDWQFLRDTLPSHLVDQIAGMDLPDGSDEDDDLIWGPDPKCIFSIKSTYEIFLQTIWRWEVPSRVKHFLWLVGHERVLTNAERCRRYISYNPKCTRCPDHIEDLLHIVRDCKLVIEVWDAFLPHNI